MSKEITQGSIIYGIRASKYPNIRCYGIVISARCDIAQCKVPKFYYLVAVDVKDWLISDTGFPSIYSEKAENRLKTHHNKYSLNHSDMMNFSEEEIRVIVDSHFSKKDSDKYLKDYAEFSKFRSSELNCNERRKVICDNPKLALDHIVNISAGNYVHLCLIPQTAYLDNNEKAEGIIVDLQEIEFFSMEDAKLIQSCGIDFMAQSFTDEEKTSLNSRYFLEKPDDFVYLEVFIGSPWIEHLMQRFSNSFARIGIDGASHAYCEQIITTI